MRDGSLTPSNDPREDVGINPKVGTVDRNLGHGYDESITRRTYAPFLVDKALEHGSLIVLTREMSGIHGVREMVVFMRDRTREHTAWDR
jgi:hypothetical protein